MEDIRRAVGTPQRIIRGRNVEQHDRFAYEPVGNFPEYGRWKIGQNEVSVLGFDPARDLLR
jgi:hypothetical protein